MKVNMEYVPVWLKKICNVKVTETEMENINFPKVEYARYISFKSAEFLGIIGVIRGAIPDRLFLSFTRGAPRMLKFKVLVKEIATTGRSWFLLGLYTGPFVALFMMHGLMMSEIYKTCYRLRNDQSEVRRDRWAIVGGASGAATGLVSGYALKLAKGFTFGGVTGCSIGCLSALAYSFVFDDDTGTSEDSPEKTIDN